MYQRIAVAGDNGSLLKTLAKAVENAQAVVSPIPKGQRVLPGSSVLVLPPEALPGALESVLAAGAEYENLLLLVADAVACREGIAMGSSKRVCEHAARFAAAYGLSAEDQYVLERAAILRDIGKMRLSNELLLSKNVLNYDEWALLQAHSRLGGDLLRERNVCADIAEVIDNHHECYDGDGYPNHLERDDIPLLARILKLLDVYCAMTSPRHYRQTVASQEQAILHIREERGKHFDPELVDVFLDAKVGRMPGE